MIIDYLRKRVELRGAYKRLFNSEDGKVVLAHLAREAGITRPQLTSDKNQILIREGRQQVVYSILREVHQGEEFLLEQIDHINNYEKNNV